MIRRLLLRTACILLIAPVAALAADNPGLEVSTAAAHADMASTAPSLGVAQMHFHHVINCLVGNEGKGYDAKAEDPCAGMGTGALNDTRRSAAEHAKLEQALTMAEQGLKAPTLAAAHATAVRVAATLQAAEGGK